MQRAMPPRCVKSVNLLPSQVLSGLYELIRRWSRSSCFHHTAQTDLGEARRARQPGRERHDSMMASGSMAARRSGHLLLPVRTGRATFSCCRHVVGPGRIISCSPAMATPTRLWTLVFTRSSLFKILPSRLPGSLAPMLAWTMSCAQRQGVPAARPATSGAAQREAASGARLLPAPRARP